jgi:hypothetical protein
VSASASLIVRLVAVPAPGFRTWTSKVASSSGCRAEGTPPTIDFVEFRMGPTTVVEVSFDEKLGVCVLW